MPLQRTRSETNDKTQYDRVTQDHASGNSQRTGSSSSANAGQRQRDAHSNSDNERETQSQQSVVSKDTSQRNGTSTQTNSGDRVSTTNRDLTSSGKATVTSTERVNIGFRVAFSVRIENGGDTPDPADDGGKSQELKC